MEEEARKLLEEGIIKKVISPGRGELSTFPNGTKVKLECVEGWNCSVRYAELVLRNAMKHFS